MFTCYTCMQLTIVVVCVLEHDENSSRLGYGSSSSQHCMAGFASKHGEITAIVTSPFIGCSTSNQLRVFVSVALICCTASNHV